MSHSAVQPRQCDDGSFIAAHPAAENRYGGLHILLLLLIFFIFNDTRRTNYLYLRQIFRVGITKLYGCR